MWLLVVNNHNGAKESCGVLVLLQNVRTEPSRNGPQDGNGSVRGKRSLVPSCRKKCLSYITATSTSITRATKKLSTKPMTSFGESINLILLSLSDGQQTTLKLSLCKHIWSKHSWSVSVSIIKNPEILKRFYRLESMIFCRQSVL